MRTRPSPESAQIACAQGLFNVVGGVWPLLHMRSFEAVTGPKADRWPVRTVAGLIVTNGAALLRAGWSGDGVATARAVGMGTALVLGAIDVVYAGRHRISPVYLLDAVMEAGWLVAWTWRSGGTAHSRAISPALFGRSVGCA